MAKKSEQSLMQKLHEMLSTQVKVYYIVWKYAPHILPKKVDTFEELTAEYKGFTKGMDEAQCERWLAEESVQAAVKYLLKRMRGLGQVVPILYCDRGGLSLQAARELKEHGYRAISVVGGIQAYRGRYLERDSR